MLTRTFRSLLIAVLSSGLALVLAAPPAAAAEQTVSTSIGAGSDNQTIGEATLTRSSAADGSETLVVYGSVPNGINESHVCLSRQPFTERVSPGQCPYGQGRTGSTVRYEIPLGTTYAGQPVYVQFHVVSKGNTAYAGWTNGSPFYGNVAVAAPDGGTPVPVGTMGGVALAALLGVALLVGSRRRRQVPALVKVDR